MSSDGTYNYTYDAEGNLKTRTKIATGKVREFTWDYRNRLTGVTDKTGGTVTQQVSYTYDALNQRIAKTVGTQTTHFVYDRNNVILEFIDLLRVSRFSAQSGAVVPDVSPHRPAGCRTTRNVDLQRAYLRLDFQQTNWVG